MAVLDKNTCANGEWNYSMLKHTVNTLKYSQGFYSRLARDMEEWSSEEIENAKQSLNNLDKFNNDLDVIMFLEQ